MWKLSSGGGSSALRVLVVDDDAGIRELLSDVLRSEGCSVETADRGDTALQKFQAEPFGLVLLDLRMPGMNGLEVLRRAKGIDPSVPVVIITGSSTDAEADQALSEGAKAVFQKPLDFSAFLPFVFSLEPATTLQTS